MIITEVACMKMMNAIITTVRMNIITENNNKRTPTMFAKTDIALNPCIIREVKFIVDFPANLSPRLVGKVS